MLVYGVTCCHSLLLSIQIGYASTSTTLYILYSGFCFRSIFCVLSIVLTLHSQAHYSCVQLLLHVGKFCVSASRVILLIMFLYYMGDFKLFNEFLMCSIGLNCPCRYYKTYVSYVCHVDCGILQVFQNAKAELRFQKVSDNST